MNQQKKPQIAVRAFITNSKGEILIIRRTNTAYGNGLWNLPGGKIDFGDTAEESVKKEIFEETSLNCISSKFLFYMDNLPDETTDLHFVALFFECKCAGDIKTNRESSDFNWINKENLNRFQFAFGNDLAIKKFNKLKEF
jgi:mutator protein MutT